MAKPRGEMSPEELTLKEAEEFVTGPMSILTNAVKISSQVLVALRNSKKILGCIKAFDRHANMMLEGAKLLWAEAPKTDKGKKRAKPDPRPHQSLRQACEHDAGRSEIAVGRSAEDGQEQVEGEADREEPLRGKGLPPRRQRRHHREESTRRSKHRLIILL